MIHWKRIRVVLVVGLLALLAVAAPAQGIVVFSNLAGGTLFGGGYMTPTIWWAVGFTVPAGSDYVMNSITLCGLGIRNPPGTGTWQLFDDNGGQPGTALTTLGTMTDVPIDTTSIETYPTGVTLTAGRTYYVVGSGGYGLVWCWATGAPSGIFSHAGNYATIDSGASWTVESNNLIIEIDADEVIPGEIPPSVDDVVPVPGCDVLLDIPSQAVVGTFTGDATIYWQPGSVTYPPVTIEAGKSYWVAGLDDSGQFYKVLLSCNWVWVEAGTVGPNYDDVWNGTPLPTEVVE